MPATIARLLYCLLLYHIRDIRIFNRNGYPLGKKAECDCLMTTTNTYENQQKLSKSGRYLLNFPEAMALYRIISKVPFKCSDQPPKIGLIDNQKQGYALRIKLGCALKRCPYCCVRDFLKSRNLQVTENENYLTISS